MEQMYDPCYVKYRLPKDIINANNGLTPLQIQTILTNKMQFVEYGGVRMLITDYILATNNISLVDGMLGDTPLPNDVKLSLLYYLIFYDVNLLPLYTENELRHIYYCDNVTLQKRLGPEYTGPIDRASLIFALLTRRSIPGPNIQDYPDKYVKVRNLNWVQIYMMTRQYMFEPYPPHVILTIF